jgi:hypothetical protein
MTTIIGDDGELEWLCPHGVGHSPAPHTCDGCCVNDPDYKEWLASARGGTLGTHVWVAKLVTHADGNPMSFDNDAREVIENAARRAGIVIDALFTSWSSDALSKLTHSEWSIVKGRQES